MKSAIGNGSVRAMYETEEGIGVVVSGTHGRIVIIKAVWSKNQYKTGFRRSARVSRVAQEN
jgi:hypothetical protein